MREFVPACPAVPCTTRPVNIPASVRICRDDLDEMPMDGAADPGSRSKATHAAPARNARG
jgi:hypothetical protein